MVEWNTRRIQNPLHLTWIQVRLLLGAVGITIEKL